MKDLKVNTKQLNSAVIEIDCDNHPKELDINTQYVDDNGIIETGEAIDRIISFVSDDEQYSYNIYVLSEEKTIIVDEKGCVYWGIDLDEEINNYVEFNGRFSIGEDTKKQLVILHNYTIRKIEALTTRLD